MSHGIFTTRCIAEGVCEWEGEDEDGVEGGVMYGFLRVDGDVGACGCGCEVGWGSTIVKACGRGC